MVQLKRFTKKDRTLIHGQTNEDRVVKFCRRIFKGKYSTFWIDTLGKEDYYVSKNFLPTIQVNLYPKLTDLRTALKKLGISPPPKFTMKKPKKPNKKHYKKEENYQKALEKYETKLAEYKEAKWRNQIEWSKYSSIVYKIVHKDINEQKKKGIQPIHITIESVKIENNKQKKTNNKGNKKGKIVYEHKVWED